MIDEIHFQGITAGKSYTVGYLYNVLHLKTFSTMLIPRLCSPLFFDCSRVLAIESNGYRKLRSLGPANSERFRVSYLRIFTVIPGLCASAFYTLVILRHFQLSFSISVYLVSWYCTANPYTRMRLSCFDVKLGTRKILRADCPSEMDSYVVGNKSA